MAVWQKFFLFGLFHEAIEMGIKIITENKKAKFEYFITERYEAGVALAGSEVKSIKMGHVNLGDAFCLISGEGEVWLKNCLVSPYEKGNAFTPEARRDRKLLLHKAEIAKLIGKVKVKGYTLVPTKLYFKDNRVKVEIGLAEGKKLHDKRRTIKERDEARQMARDIKEYR